MERLRSCAIMNDPDPQTRSTFSPPRQSPGRSYFLNLPGNGSADGGLFQLCEAGAFYGDRVSFVYEIRDICSSPRAQKREVDRFRE